MDNWNYGVWSPWYNLQKALREGLSGSSPGHVPVPLPEKIDDHVYEICKPGGEPSIEIVVFHGLQLEDYQEAYMTTWMSRDNSECWLRWLIDDFPKARILTVSYDASARKTNQQGWMDMYVTGENLVHSLTRRAAVGQDGCPVLLVGHCLGGLVMKELCYQALLMHTLDWSDEPVDNFLINVKGFLFYGTPHNGSFLADATAESLGGPLLGDLTMLNTNMARSNETFRKLRKKYKWKTSGIGESLPVNLKTFKGVVVPEASSRHDMDKYYTVCADHYNVCKPQHRKSNTFQALADFIRILLKEAEDVSTGCEAGSGSLLETVGLEAQTTAVIEKWQGGVGCRRLGIVGMGGIGKTTLARAVFQKMLMRFDYACFFEEVKKATVKEESLHGLQAKILDRLHYKGKKLTDERRSDFRWSELQGKKVLFVLDDVESVNQVRVFTQLDGFHIESRLIVTSRNRGFLGQLKFELHFVQKLNPRDSKSLFCLHAFKDSEIPETFKKRVTRLVDKCDGLPLTLRVVGSYLFNRQEEGVWDDALKKLRRAQSLDGECDDNLWAKLRVSIDSLATVEKEMFLDVATCFHGDNLDQVKAVWRACDWGSPDSGWQNLLDRCLVSETYYKRVWMHEQLRDLGWSIACPGQNVAEHSRVNGLKAANQLASCNQVQAKVEVLRIVDIDQPSANLKFLCGLKELRVLWLGGISRYFLEWDVCPSQLCFLYSRDQIGGVPHETSKMISEIHSLRCLILDGYPDLERLRPRNVTSLERLDLHNCWDLETLPESLGQLHALRHLEIVNCRRLRELRVGRLGQLHALGHLEIVNCEELRTLHVGHLPALNYLEVVNCRSTIIVSTAGFWKLQDLRHLHIWECKAISGCYELCNWENGDVGLELKPIQSMEFKQWEQLRGVKHLDDSEIVRVIHMLRHGDEISWNVIFVRSSCQETDFESYWGQLVIDSATKESNFKFLSLDLPAVQRMTIQTDSHILFKFLFGQLHSLKRLDLSYCQELESLPEALGELRELRSFTVDDCTKLTVLPECLRQLQALQEIRISKCERLESLPEALGELRALQELEISYCARLASLPVCLGKVSSLRFLSITDCSGIWTLPASLGQLSSLQSLRISRCSGLRILPKSLGQLSSLRSLYIVSCSGLRTLPKSLGQLSSLRSLYMSGCSGLRTLPDSFAQLPALEYFDADGCDELERTFRAIITQRVAKQRLEEEIVSQALPLLVERETTEENQVETRPAPPRPLSFPCPFVEEETLTDAPGIETSQQLSKHPLEEEELMAAPDPVLRVHDSTFTSSMNLRTSLESDSEDGTCSERKRRKA